MTDLKVYKLALAYIAIKILEIWVKTAVIFFGHCCSSVLSDLNSFSKRTLFNELSATGKIGTVYSFSIELHMKMRTHPFQFTSLIFLSHLSSCLFFSFLLRSRFILMSYWFDSWNCKMFKITSRYWWIESVSWVIYTIIGELFFFSTFLFRNRFRLTWPGLKIWLGFCFVLVCVVSRGCCFYFLFMSSNGSIVLVWCVASDHFKLPSFLCRDENRRPLWPRSLTTPSTLSGPPTASTSPKTRA